MELIEPLFSFSVEVAITNFVVCGGSKEAE
jgi:hypothetical protein